MTALISVLNTPDYEMFIEVVGDRNYIHTDVRVWNRSVYKELRAMMALYIELTEDKVLYAAILNPKVAKFAERFGFKPTGEKLDMKHRIDNTAYVADIYKKEL